MPNAKQNLKRSSHHRSLGAQHLVAAWIAVWLALGWISMAVGQDVAVRTVNGLSERRLFDLAMVYGQEVLETDRGDLSDQVRVDLVVALTEALTQKAWQGSQPELWEAATQFAESWENRIDSPRRILITVQSVLVQQVRIEKWVRQFELQLTTSVTRAEAQAALANLIRRLESLQQQINQLINRQRRPGPTQDAFQPNELLALRHNLQYQQSKSLLHRAGLYGEDQQLNRKDNLALAQQQLQQVLLSVGPDESLWWKVQSDRMKIARQTHDNETLSQIIGNLPPAGDDRIEGRQSVLAEWVRALVEQRNFEEAMAVAGDEVTASSTPEMDLARLHLFVEMADRQRGGNWQEKALELASDIETVHGGYWGRQANLEVIGTAGAAENSQTSLALLIRTADEAQRKKQWQEAIRALETAYQQAIQAGEVETAWKLGFRSASIRQHQSQHAEAADRFQELAVAHPELPEAAAGFLMACWNLAKTVGDDRERFQRYESMLEQLLETWPESSSADQARIWLAAIRYQQKNWPAAIGQLLAVDSMSPLFGKAVQALRNNVRALMTGDKVKPSTRTNIGSTVKARLAPLLNADTGAMPDNWPQTIQQIVLQLAELKWLHGVDVPVELVSRLQNLIDSNTAKPAEKASAQVLAWIARSLSGEDVPLFPLAKDSTLADRQIAALFRGLTSADPDALSDRRGKLLRKVADEYAQAIQRLPVGRRKAWRIAILDAWEQSGDWELAADYAKTLAREEFPRDASIQVRYARLLTEWSEDSAEAAEAALRQWRIVARGARKDSDHWYLAKYHVAKLLAETGKTEDALKLLRYIQAVPPGWQQAPNADQFEELYHSLGG